MTRVQAFDREEDDKNPDAPALMWREFVDNTTLHGLRYVFLKRPRWIRALWLLLVLTSTGYYMNIVYNAVNKFLDRPMNTIIRTKYVKEIDFPAVTICPLNSFSLRKISLLDDEREFEKELNMTECAATAAVRAGKPCGVALLCCCGSAVSYFSISSMFPSCTAAYKQELASALKKQNISPNISEFYRLYGVDIRELLTPVPQCLFGLEDESCDATDFDAKPVGSGNCFTFNSGKKAPVRKALYHGASNGLNVMLDARTHDYTTGQFSEGFRIIVHQPGEYVSSWDGIHVGPGTHVSMITSRIEIKNLPAPYDTNCKDNKLKHLSYYTMDGCAYECEAKNRLDKCKCRTPEYDAGDKDARFCSTEDRACLREADRTMDYNECNCSPACSRVKYSTTASYSKFPDTITRKSLDFYNWTDEYKRKNLVFVQVGFTSLVHTIWEQKPAYDSGALFGEIGGNMGLFLGCSLLTICEFVDFMISVCISKRRRRALPV